MQGSKETRMSKYMLTKIEFDHIKGFLEYWRSKPEYEELKSCNNFIKTRDSFIQWTLEYLMKFYPTIKYKILEYKTSIKLKEEKENNVPIDPEREKDTIAFKFQKGRPELYLLIQRDPMLLDEARFDAYDKGPFMKPNWED